MCHTQKLSVVNQERLRRMPLEYRQQLESALENEGYVASTWAAVTPVFERVYARWQEREEARTAARKTAERTVTAEAAAVNS